MQCTATPDRKKAGRDILPFPLSVLPPSCSEVNAFHYLHSKLYRSQTVLKLLTNSSDGSYCCFGGDAEKEGWWEAGDKEKMGGCVRFSEPEAEKT